MAGLAGRLVQRRHRGKIAGPDRSELTQAYHEPGGGPGGLYPSPVWAYLEGRRAEMEPGEIAAPGSAADDAEPVAGTAAFDEPGAGRDRTQLRQPVRGPGSSSAGG